jgi:DNA invertase Pin-like site-specific DNA recombinase
MISPENLASIRVRFAEKPHGTRHRYLGGCRCVPCRAANSRYSTGRAAAQRAGDWRGFVPATLVLGHIQKLRKSGIGYKAIGAAADLAKSTLAMILTGQRAQIRKHNADRILAVDKSAMADHALVPAGRTWTLLNELLEAGYTKTFLAKQLGSRAKRPSLQIQADRIAALTASKVERLYRRIREGRVRR